MCRRAILDRKNRTQAAAGGDVEMVDVSSSVYFRKATSSDQMRNSKSHSPGPSCFLSGYRTALTKRSMYVCALSAHDMPQEVPSAIPRSWLASVLPCATTALRLCTRYLVECSKWYISVRLSYTGMLAARETGRN